MLRCLPLFLVVFSSLSCSKPARPGSSAATDPHGHSHEEESQGEHLALAKGTVGRMHYTITDETGKERITTRGQDPAVFMFGDGHFFEALTAALKGKKAGDKFEVTLTPAEAFGPRDPLLVQTVPRDAFDPALELAEGMETPLVHEGQPKIVTITKVEGENIGVDLNRPLAGHTLTFKIQIVEVRKATEEELAHGHVHGPGGHAH